MTDRQSTWKLAMQDPERSRRSRRNPHTNDVQPDYEFASRIFVKLRWLAIRAAKFLLFEPTFP